jgi:hypothetical protein
METDLKWPEPAKALHKLDVFLGSWIVEGQNGPAAPFAPFAEVEGNIFYQWMPGGFFMTANWHRKFAYLSHIGLSVIEANGKTGSFAMHNFDNMGHHRIYALSNEDRRWIVEGKTERAKIAFDAAGDSFTETWESLGEDGWQLLCKLKVIKI